MKLNKLPPPIAYGEVNKKMNGFSLDKKTHDWLKSQHPNDLKIVRKEFPYFIF